MAFGDVRSMKKHLNKIDVVLAQPGFQTGPTQSWYLPYTIGCLWAYASHDPFIKKNVNIVELIWGRNIIDQQIKSWQNIDVLFCSVYLWNDNYCKELSIATKEKFPNVKIIWGGPQCDHTCPDIFKKQPYIDAIAVSEGEQTFKEILERIIYNKKIDDVESCLINNNGQPNMNKLRPRASLDGYPSPYLTGVFDEIVDKNPTVSWSTILETTRGCPYSCTFCDWGSLTSAKLKTFEILKVEEELKWINDHNIKFIALADANFGIFKERDLEIAKTIRRTNPQLEGLSWNPPKNKTISIIEIAQELKDINHNGVALSVQSLDPHTLQAIKRSNMEINDIGKIIIELEKHNIKYYTDLILGLPGETLQSFKKNIWTMYENNLHTSIGVYMLTMAVNAELNLTQKQEYEMKTKNIKCGEGNYIDEYTPVVVSTKDMSYEDYLDAWQFVKVQRILHGGGFSLQASKLCYKQGISYQDFYQHLEILLNQHDEWKELSTGIKVLFDRIISGQDNITERSIDKHLFLSAFKCRNLIFNCIGKTLEHFQIENIKNVLEQSKALVYDPYNSNQWPKIVNGKTYTYVGRSFKNADDYAYFLAYRRGSIHVEVSEIA